MFIFLRNKKIPLKEKKKSWKVFFPDSRRTLLSKGKNSCWVGNTELSNLCPCYAHRALLWKGICWQAQTCCPLGCPAESRAARAAVLCWTGVHSVGAGTVCLSSARSSTACPWMLDASLMWLDTYIFIRVGYVNFKPMQNMKILPLGSLPNSCTGYPK